MDDVAVLTADNVMALPLECGPPDYDEAAFAASKINDALAETLHIATAKLVEHASDHAGWCAAVGAAARDLAIEPDA